MKRILFAIILLFTSANIKAQQYEPLIKGWKFKKNYNSETPAQTNFSTSDWETVNIPHTWNNMDGQDGGNDYVRCTSWYRYTLNWNEAYKNKDLFLEFLGVNKQCQVYVNGTLAGEHKGGYTAFRIPITPHISEGANTIAVKVNNERSEEIAPITADFTFWGGIYRNVNLVIVNPVHVNLMDNGSNGLYLTTTNVSKQSATLGVKSRIVNNSNKAKSVTITAQLKHPEAFVNSANIANLPFDTAQMATVNKTVAVETISVKIPAHSHYDFSKNFNIESPRLWNGKKDPFRYKFDLIVADNKNRVIDIRSDYVGFRFFEATTKGFFLNGEHYQLLGVTRHQDRKNMGNALTPNEHEEDFSLIYEMGANSIRLAHYPQAPYMYELCDKYGIVVWAEIPFVDHVGKADTFADVTEQQLREMIRQNYNRPSIVMWGLQNEVRGHYDKQMRILMERLNNAAHSEDATRYTVQATNHHTAYNWASDLMGWNTYPGWYGGGRLGERMDGFMKREQPTCVSEYGYGASIYHHEINPPQPKAGGAWHPEEYQTMRYEMAIKDIMERPEMWGTYLWNMFDFAADQRSEGDHLGMNDKGLVTYDRKVKKDAFYLYKANWNAEPMIHIASKRMNPLPTQVMDVTVYSNCDTLELIVNGKSMGKKVLQVNDRAIAKWQEVQFNVGRNLVEARGINGNKTFTDATVWYVPEIKGGDSSNYLTTEANTLVGKLQSDYYSINHQQKTVKLKPNDLKNILQVETFLSRFKANGLELSTSSKSYFIQDGDLLKVKNKADSKVVDYKIQK